MSRIPLFTLNTVLFPGGSLTLRVFEPRYMRMISQSMKEQAPFGVCLIRTGREVGPAANPYGIGTLARIVDWEQRNDGLLGITARGEQRFRIDRSEADAQQLLYADVTLLEDGPAAALDERHRPLADLLRRAMADLGVPEPEGARYDDAGWVGYRLAELLPLPLRHKQRLLQADDPRQRLDLLQRMLQPKT